ncbi:MAG TPA: hypothetical protein VNS63_21935 [Blastocatellia bacterium]|nr:hypothetical protein [Blastocatellia bacterium]
MDAITAIVGIGGLLVAGYGVYVVQRAKRPHIKVTLNLGVRYYQTSGMRTRSDAKLLLKAVNVGERPVVLDSHALLFPNREAMAFPLAEADVRFPHELLPENSCTVYFDARKLVPTLTRLKKNRRGMVYLWGFYKDMAGRMNMCKKLELDPTLEVFHANLRDLDDQTVN